MIVASMVSYSSDLGAARGIQRSDVTGISRRASFDAGYESGSTIGIAVVQMFFYSNTQAMHLALAKNLTPFRTAAHVAGPIAKSSLVALNGLVTQQAAVVAVIDQFKILMLAMLIVSPLVPFLHKARLAD